MAFLQELRSALISQTKAYNALVSTDVTIGLRSEEAKAKALEKQKADLSLLKTRVNGLGEVWSYIQSGTWSTKKDFVQRVIYLTEHDRKTAIQNLGLSGDNHANTLFYRANKILSEKFGSDLIRNILGVNPEQAILQFRSRAGIVLSDTCFVQEAKELLPLPDNNIAFRLSDCVNEAKFLAFYSKAVLSKRFAALDKQKLAYLLFLLTTAESDYSSQQVLLAKIVNGECSANVLTEVLDNPLQKLPNFE